MFNIKLCKNVIPGELVEELVNDFTTNCDQLLPGRRFYTNIEYAKKLVVPIIKNHLPGDWVVDGGNYFETVRPYRLHCDSGKDPVKRLYYNIVIPLKLWATNYRPELNKLIVTNQTWNGDAAFFIKGDVGQNEYNICVTDYEDVGNLSSESDSELMRLCPHLNPQNLDGMSMMETIDWVPGDIMIFRRNLIHTTSDWRSAGVTQKLGLSLFTSYNTP
jgi:hypothetical protein